MYFNSSYLLPDDKNIKSCKTGRAKKSSSPVWDEYFVIDGVAQSQLQKKQLGIRVVNWQLGFNRKNSRLGELRIGCTEVFDFQTLPSPNTSHVVKSQQKEETVNEGIIYSPLVPVDEERQKKRNFGPPSHETEKKVVEKSVSDTLDNVFFEKDQSYVKEAEERKDNSSRDNEQTQNKKSNTLLQNLQRLNGARNGGDEKKTGEEHHFGEQHAKTEEDRITDENENKMTSSKPQRPPPPNLLKLKELYLSSNSTAKQDQESKNKPASPRKANTPTMSRLMMKLPMSPRHDRRSSWGGESDMSLSSPRSARSPSDYKGLESRQWDLMINKPKEWIYCWQTLDVFNSSE